jgi:hypothetical protein
VRKKENLKINKNGRGRRRVREKENNNNKKNGQERGTVREREKKKFPCRFGIRQSLCHMEWGKKWEEKKMSLHFTLKRVKVSFFKFYKRNKKEETEKNQKITFLWAGVGR